MDGLDQQRVAGWLVLNLQYACGPLDESRVNYTTTERGCVEVTWRGGPSAGEVEALLLARADPTAPVTRIEAPGGDSSGAVIDVGGVRVALHAVEPRCRRGPREAIGASPTWQPPRPLLDDGHALDVVTWAVQPEPGGVGEAVVHRSPTSVLEDAEWSDGDIVAHLGWQPSPTAHPARLARWNRAREIAEVHFRTAGPGWSDADADGWLLQMLDRWTAACLAVVWRDRCLIRLPHAGLRIEAHFETYPGSGIVTQVPSTVLSAWRRTPDEMALPNTLIVNRLGYSSQRYRVRLHTTVAVPTA